MALKIIKIETIPHQEMASLFLIVKPLLDLIFNSQKCCHSFANWYNPNHSNYREVNNIWVRP